jgi:hypothetical protein
VGSGVSEDVEVKVAVGRGVFDAVAVGVELGGTGVLEAVGV